MHQNIASLQQLRHSPRLDQSRQTESLLQIRVGDLLFETPSQMTVTDEVREVTASFVSGTEHARDLVFDSDFENGNGIPRYIYRNSRMTVFEPEQIRGADNIWWHFKIRGITPGEFLQIWPLHSSLGDEENIAWAGDCHPVYSYDGVTWHRFAGMRPPYVQRFAESEVEIARNIPYTHSQAVALAARMSAPYVQAIDLAISEEGHPVKMLRFSDPSVPEESKDIIWIMARQHAFESHSSWYAEGICEWLHGNHPLAADLRRRAITYVTPIMDVDNVYQGGSGKEQLTASGQRADYNRSWGEDSPWEVIRKAKSLLLELREEHHVAAFIDLHNPWYPRPSYWGIASAFAEEVLPFADMWSECLAKTGSGAMWKHDLRVRPEGGAGAPGHTDREPTAGTMTAQQWAKRALADRSEGRLFFLIEIAHWKDGYGHFITTQSLRAYGEAMGRALAKWIPSRAKLSR